MRVQQAMLLPIKLGLPFGDQLADDWHTAVNAAQQHQRLHVGLSVHPRAGDAISRMRLEAARGGRIIKLHPTVQRFYPDEPALMDLYAEAQKLGLVVFFHGGRAGIEPELTHRYAMPKKSTVKHGPKIVCPRTVLHSVSRARCLGKLRCICPYQKCAAGPKSAPIKAQVSRRGQSVLLPPGSASRPCAHQSLAPKTRPELAALVSSGDV